MNLDRFQPPKGSDELYRCTSCGEMIGEGSNVFIEDIPYHLECVPELPFEDEQENRGAHHRHVFRTWMGYCTVCACILIVALALRNHEGPVKGLLVTGCMALASLWLIVSICRK